MAIRILQLLGGAGRATGATVIIDVFRACATICHALAAGAERIVPVADLETAYALKAAHPDYVLMGERDCLKPDGFDYGNSPTELAGLNLTGATCVHATTAGTRGLTAALAAGAGPVLAGSFVNMTATADYLRALAPETVSLVAMGRRGQEPAPEDNLCAMYLKNELEAVPNVLGAITGFLRNTPSAAIFFGETAVVPETDFDLCLALDAFDFAVLARLDRDGGPELRRATP